MTYLNNAGTSWPKPPEVAAAVGRVLTEPPPATAGLLEEATRNVAAFLGIAHPERLLFTTGCTAALALAFDDLEWQPGDVIVTSSMEHHGLIRPVERLVRTAGVRHHAVPRASDGPICLERLETTLATSGVRLVAMTMAANVTGEILPVGEISELAHTHGALVLIDAAQATGIIPVDVERIGADMLAFAGHKGMLGPLGVGGIYIAPAVELVGSTASCEIRAGVGASCTDWYFPTYCDVGGASLPAIAGLAAGVRWVTERGVEALTAAGRRRVGRLLEGLVDLPEVSVHGHDRLEERTLAVSITHARVSPAELEAYLQDGHGLSARAGHHCAPMAACAIGTDNRGGTLRVSFGPFSNDSDVDTLITALTRLA
ncbi:MAG: aminotransferase class V-fold PLP-dependent enzyme [Myxococcales bacterium]|nr:MAG: aminotransferase class V-fold PLP-dependent enzyme [Myxococcales bacterium]